MQLDAPVWRCGTCNIEFFTAAELSKHEDHAHRTTLRN